MFKGMAITCRTTVVPSESYGWVRRFKFYYHHCATRHLVFVYSSYASVTTNVTFLEDSLLFYACEQNLGGTATSPK